MGTPILKKQEFEDVVSLSWSPEGEVTLHFVKGEKMVGRVKRLLLDASGDLDPARRTLTFFLPTTCRLFDSERMYCEWLPP